MNEKLSLREHGFVSLPVPKEPFFPGHWYVSACADTQTTIILPSTVQASLFAESLRRFNGGAQEKKTFFFSENLPQEKNGVELRIAAYEELLQNAIEQAVETFTENFNQDQFVPLCIACVQLVNQIAVAQRAGAPEAQFQNSQTGMLEKYVNNFLLSHRKSIREQPAINRKSYLAACRFLLRECNTVADRIGGVHTVEGAQIADIHMMEELPDLAAESQIAAPTQEAAEAVPYVFQKYIDAALELPWQKQVLSALGFVEGRFILTQELQATAKKLSVVFGQEFAVTSVASAEGGSSAQLGSVVNAEYTFEDYLQFIADRVYGKDVAEVLQYISDNCTPAGLDAIKHFITNYELTPHAFVIALQRSFARASTRFDKIDGKVDGDFISKTFLQAWFEQEGAFPDDQRN